MVSFLKCSFLQVYNCFIQADYAQLALSSQYGHGDQSDVDQDTSVSIDSDLNQDEGGGSMSNMIRSNLTCYVCVTIDDMACKYINETMSDQIMELMHHQQQQQQQSPISSALRSNDPSLNEQDQQLLMASILHEYHNGGKEREGRSPSLTPTKHGLSSVTPPSIGSTSTDTSYSVYSHDHLRGGDEHEDESGSSIHTSPVSGNDLESKRRRFGAECQHDEPYCIVLRLGVNTKETGLDHYNFFALKRGCAKQCTDGCFIIGKGERTKLSFCSTCCTKDYCNVGNSSPKTCASFFPLVLLLTFLKVKEIQFWLELEEREVHNFCWK